MSARPDQERSAGIGSYRHIALGDVGSTNSECLDRARAGDPGRLWITAERQLQGRGRRGRAWVSERGNLYASLLLIDPAPPAQLGSLPLVAAVALHRAIEQVLAPDLARRLMIKWPNDLLLDGAKLCGILLESEALADGRRAVVVGCGVNVGHAPEAGSYRTVSLAEAGAASAPELIFGHLVATMAEELDIWQEGSGLGRTLAAWRERATGIGAPITVNLGSRTIEGRFLDIDAAGRLLLQGKKGEQMTIAAGDVFFGENNISA